LYSRCNAFAPFRRATPPADGAFRPARRRVPFAAVLRYVLAGMLSVLLTAAVIALAVSAVSDGEARAVVDPTATTPPDGAPPQAELPQQPAEPVPPLPPAQGLEVREAAKAAGCTLEKRPNEGAEHTTDPLTAADYRSNPPTSGIHAPAWYEDGIYAPGTTPNLGMLVHALEHGRIHLQYAPGTPAPRVGQLELLVNELDSGYHLLLFQNETQMPYAFAATAWDRLLGCPELNDRVFEAVRAFRDAYIDKAPEVIP
jgi:hypothetical protein